MSSYVPILLFAVLVFVFPLVTMAIGSLVRPKKYERAKLEPYECGIEPHSGAHERLSVRYYVLAVLFVVFDVETIFLFPWAVKYDFLALFGFVEMTIFLGILVFGYVYAWKKGALEWV